MPSSRARAIGVRVGGRETTRKGPDTGPGATRRREIEVKREVKDTPRRVGAVGTGGCAKGLWGTGIVRSRDKWELSEVD